MNDPANDPMHALLHKIDGYLYDLVTLFDIDKRAWVLGGVVFLEELRQRSIEQVPLSSLVERAFADDGFPAVPSPFTPRDLAWKVHDKFDYADTSIDVNDYIGLDVKLATDRRCAVGEGLSRARLDDGSLQPTHVLLSDVEAVAVDCVALARALSAHTHYEGPALLLVKVLCESPEAPLELRVYDEGNGEHLRPPAGYRYFAPMRMPFNFPLTEDEEQRLLWDLARDMCLQFGVFEPQLIRPPSLQHVTA